MFLSSGEIAALKAALGGISFNSCDPEIHELLMCLCSDGLCDSLRNGSRITYTTNAKGRAMLMDHAQAVEYHQREEASREAADKCSREQ